MQHSFYFKKQIQKNIVAQQEKVGKQIYISYSTVTSSKSHQNPIEQVAAKNQLTSCYYNIGNAQD